MFQKNLSLHVPPPTFYNLVYLKIWSIMKPQDVNLSDEIMNKLLWEGSNRLKWRKPLVENIGLQAAINSTPLVLYVCIINTKDGHWGYEMNSNLTWLRALRVWVLFNIGAVIFFRGGSKFPRRESSKNWALPLPFRRWKIGDPHFAR